MSDPDVKKTAKEFIDAALAARGRLGYSTKVSRKSYGRAISQAASAFETLRRTTSTGETASGRRDPQS